MKKIKQSNYQITMQSKLTGKRAVSVFLTDLHDVSLGNANELLLKKIAEIAPDFILAGGDMISAKEGHYRYHNGSILLKTLAASYPTFAAFGNHEQRMKEHPKEYNDLYNKLIQDWTKHGVQIVENKRIAFRVNGIPFVITGLEIEQAYYARFRTICYPLSQITDKLGSCSSQEYQILLAHNPLFFDTYQKWGANLVYSGHVHGGIVRIPWLGGLLSPSGRLFPHYDKGMYLEGESTMIVGAGLGYHSGMIRVNNPPEIVVTEYLY